MAIITNQQREPLDVFDAYDSIKWSRSLFKPSAFELVVNINLIEQTAFELGNLILINEEQQFGFSDIGRMYMIEQMESQLDENGKETELITVTGRSIGGMFEERIILPPTGEEFLIFSGNAENVIKSFVKNTAGSLSAGFRRIPDLYIPPNQDRGDFITYKGRFEQLSEVLEKVGKATGVGWEVEFNLDENRFELSVIPPIDKTAGSEQPTFLDVDFETILSQSLLRTQLEKKTVAVVGGAGEGVQREVITTRLTDDIPSGFERKETFVDAGNLEEEEDLIFTGQDELRETEQEDVVEAEFNPVGSYDYPDDIDLGDVITLQNKKWGVDIDLQVVGLTIRVDRQSGQPNIELQLGRTYPTIRNKVQREVGRRERQRV